jgi:NAD(P)-dependent dehydrogenase (short-subunit alcohol dehydrogenase family)
VEAAEHPIAHRGALDVRAHRQNGAYELMSDGEAALDRYAPVVDVQVRAADAAGFHADECVLGVLELRVRDILHQHLAGSLERDGAHRPPTIDDPSASRVGAPAPDISRKATGFHGPPLGSHRPGANPYAARMTEPSKAVLITGCSSGIGRATALRLARLGWKVYATARRPESIAALTDAGCETLALDVTDEESMRAAVDQIEGAEGAIGVLINNAGYSQGGAIETVSMDAVRRQFETNVFGLVRLTQLVLGRMREQRWGKIVNVGSMGGLLTLPGAGHYHATKHALEALSDAMRYELRGFGIDVILLEPGLIRTDFGEAAVASIVQAQADPAPEGDDPYAQFNAAVGAVTKGGYDGPLGRLGAGPDRVAKVIEKALKRRRPPTRITITPSAKLRLLSDRAWDAAMRGQYPPPG